MLFCAADCAAGAPGCGVPNMLANGLPANCRRSSDAFCESYKDTRLEIAHERLIIKWGKEKPEDVPVDFRMLLHQTNPRSAGWHCWSVN